MRRIVSLGISSSAVHPHFRDPRRQGDEYLQVVFEDGTTEFFQHDGFPLEELLGKMGLLLPTPRAPLYAGPHGPDQACDTCAACHHKVVAPDQALRALGLRVSIVKSRLVRAGGNLLWSRVLPRWARVHATSFGQVLRAMASHLVLGVPDTLEAEVNALIDHVEEVELYEVSLPPGHAREIDGRHRRWIRARGDRKRAGSAKSQ